MEPDVSLVVVEGDCFEDMDSQDLNDLDPIGGGFPVNESEAALDEESLDEYVRDAQKAYRRELTRQKQKRGKDEDKKDDKKVDESEVSAELVETLKAYEGVVKKLRTDHGKLQQELRQSNLSNAKLVYATKLMQNENLSEKKRRVVLEQLDQAQSVREVKKLFTALSEALSGKKGEEQEQLTEGKEGRNILGGSSKATKSGGSKLTESEQKEYSRWGELAGVLNG